MSLSWPWGLGHAQPGLLVIGEVFFCECAGDRELLLLGSWQLEHGIIQHGFHDAAEAACAELEFNGFLYHVIQPRGVKLEVNAVHFEQLDVLFAQRVLGLGQDLSKR